MERLCRISFFNVKTTAIGTRGAHIGNAFSSLNVRSLKSSPFVDDKLIGSLFSEGKLVVLILIVDPDAQMSFDIKVKALKCVSTVYDLPVA